MCLRRSLEAARSKLSLRGVIPNFAAPFSRLIQGFVDPAGIQNGPWFSSRCSCVTHLLPPRLLHGIPADPLGRAADMSLHVVLLRYGRPARIEHIEIIVKTLPGVSQPGWHGSVQSSLPGKRLEINQGDIGLPCGQAHALWWT